MKEIGELLKKTREEKGISLDEISDATKIQKRHLGSLEKGDFSTFPGEVYLRGAIRNYAQAIGLDPQEVLSIYNSYIRQKNNSESLKKNEKKKIAEESKPFVFKNRKKPLPLAALIWIVLLAIVVAGSVWYLSQQASQENARIPYASEPMPEENGAEKVDDFIIPEEEPLQEPEIIIVSSSSNEVIYMLSKVEQKQVDLNFSGRCWVRIEQDGNLIEETTYASGDSTQLGNALETRIRLGNPPVVVIKVNGLELEDLTGINNPIDIIIRKES